MFVIISELYLDQMYYRALPSTIGPFISREEADTFIGSMAPLWGSYTVTPLTDANINTVMVCVTDNSG